MSEKDQTDRRMWEVLNIIRPAETRRRNRDNEDTSVPLADERVNAIFPTRTGGKPAKKD